MKILLINNVLTDEGGAEQVVLKTGDLLNKKGHEVFYYGTNKDSVLVNSYEYRDYFPEFINYSSLSKYQLPLAALNLIYNVKAKHKLEKYLDEIKPDIVHMHNIVFSLSSSVIDACASKRVPVVMTLHNPYFVCPAITLQLKSEYYCKDCLCVTSSPLQCIINKCFHRNLFKSILITMEYFVRKRKSVIEKVSMFISPSQKLLDLTVKAGINENKIVQISNFADNESLKIKPNYSNKKYFLYAGRLSAEKGVDILIKAFQSCPDSYLLHIIGDGGEKEDLIRLAGNNKNIIFKGFLKGEKLQKEYRNCIATILPTVGFENCPLSVIDSFCFGKPVIGSNIGGIPELIEDKITGLLVEAGNIDQLTRAIKSIFENVEYSEKLGENGRNKIEQFYSIDSYYDKLIKTYQGVLNSEQ